MDAADRRVEKWHELEDELKKKLALLLPASDRDPLDHAALILDRVQKLVKDDDLTPLEVSDLLRRYVLALKPDALITLEKKKDRS